MIRKNFHMILLVFLCILLLNGTCMALEESNADTTVLSGNVVMGQNGAYDFAGIYTYHNLTIEDNTIISSDGISQLVLKVEGTLHIGENVVIRVRNGYYPAAPALSTDGVTVQELSTQGIDTGEGYFVYPNTFGHGGNGGNGGSGAPGGRWYYLNGWVGFSGGSGGGGGGGGYGGGQGGFQGAGGLGNFSSDGTKGSDGYSGSSGLDFGDRGGYGGKNPYAAQGGGAHSIGYSGTSDQGSGAGGAGGGGNGGNGGAGSSWSNIGTYWNYYGGGGGGGGGGGYGGGILTLVADYIEAPSNLKLIVGGQFGGVGGVGASTGGASGQNGFGGEDGLIIINANRLSMPNPAWQTGTYSNIRDGHGKVSCIPGAVFWGLGSGMESFPEPISISIPSNQTIYMGESVTLTPMIHPESVMTSLTWQSNDTSIATVSKDGVVTAVDAGTAVITVTTRNGLKASCTITVPEPALRLTAVIPTNQAQDLPADTQVKFTFSQELVKGSAFQQIKLWDQIDNISVAATVSIQNMVLTIIPQSPLTYGHTYTVTIPSNALKNTQGQENKECFTTSFTIKFAGPKLVNVQPSETADESAVSLTFDCNAHFVSWALADTVKVYEYNWFTEIPIDTYTVSSESIKFASDAFLPGTTYRIEVPAGVVECDGISNAMPIVAVFQTPSIWKQTLQAPTISPNGRRVSSKQYISITSASDADIYYTLDGSNPRYWGQRYERAFTISEDVTMIRAIAIQGGVVSQESVAQFSMIKEPELSHMQTYLPTGSKCTGYYKPIRMDDGLVVFCKDETDSLQKINTSGEISWTTKTGALKINDIAEVNGQIIAVGQNKYTFRPCAAAYSETGEFLWQKSYVPEAQNGSFTAVVSTEYGFAMVGQEMSDINDGAYYQAMLTLCDTQGEVIRQVLLGSEEEDEFTDVTLYEDGIIAVGMTVGSNLGKDDWDDIPYIPGATAVAVIVKFDLEGNVIWKKAYGEKGYRVVTPQVAATKQGFLIVASEEASSSAETPIALWYNSAGELITQEKLQSYRTIYDLTKGSSDYLAVGYSRYTGTYEPYFVRLSGNGEVLYQNYTFDSGIARGAVEIGDNRYLVVGEQNDVPWSVELFWNPPVVEGTVKLTDANCTEPGDISECQVWLNPPLGVDSGKLHLHFDDCISVQSLVAGAGNVRLEEVDGGVDLTWSRENFSVDAGDGYLLGRMRFLVDNHAAEGEYPVTVSAEGFSTVEGCTITVKDPSVLLVDIVGPAEIHGQYQYMERVIGGGADIGETTWSVSDPSIAEVDSYGVLRPKKSGTVALTAMVDGVASEPFTITIGNLFRKAAVFVDQNGDYLDFTIRLMGVSYGHIVIALYDKDTGQMQMVKTAVMDGYDYGKISVPRLPNVYAKVMVINNTDAMCPLFEAVTLNCP